LDLFDFDFNFPLVDPKTGMASEAFKKWIVLAKKLKAKKASDPTENNIALLDDEGNPKNSSSSLSDITAEIGAPFAELTSTKIVAYDSSGGILQEIDLSDWITEGTGITVTDDGDGTITITIKNQSNIVDASEDCTITDPTDSPADVDALRDDLVANVLPDVKSAIDANGAKINAILDLLLASELMDGP